MTDVPGSILMAVMYLAALRYGAVPGSSLMTVLCLATV
jgi:hypothetical protein